MMNTPGEFAPVTKTPWYRSFRFWLSAITTALVVGIVWAAWPTIIEAFNSIGRANPWILALLVPVQIFSFAMTGQVLFSYLRARGELHSINLLTAIRMSLEFNFANHMLPSGGAAGITYTSWKLNTLGVSASKGTLAQLTRFAVTFASFTIVVTAATIWLLASGKGEPALIWTAVGIGVLSLVIVLGGFLLLRKRRPLHRFAGFLTRVLRALGRIIKKPSLANPITLVRFFDGLHKEMKSILEEPRALRAPFFWSFFVHLGDAGLYWVALAAFGIFADPALIFVAYGAATVASIVIVTPNGVGAYEVVLIGLLVSGGLSGPTVVAAIVLARAILLIGTIVFGWGFYQHSISRSGKPPAPKQ